MPVPKLLAIDFGRDTGIAVNKPFGWKSMKMPVKNTEAAFYDFLMVLLLQHKPDAIVYEDVKRHSSTAAAHWFGAWRGIAHLAAQKYKVETVGVGVGEWKKHLTGKGMCKKPERGMPIDGYLVYQSLRKRGYDIRNDNAADAMGILLYAVECGIVEMADG